MKTLVAFGGNAISRADQAGTFEEQLQNVRAMSDALAELVMHGVDVIVTHGNGPQVGRIALQQDLGARSSIPPMPFDASGAMSEGLIGYMLQQSLRNTLDRRRLQTTCVTLVTQVVVARDDPAFDNPSKPVGGFYSEEEAETLRAEKSWTIVEDAGRGYRRVVPSPQPLSIVEWPAIEALIAKGMLVIAAGGGGIPVVECVSDGIRELRGVEAVIDKDRASARLGSLVGVDTLVLLTDVDRVAVEFGTENQRWLDRIGLDEMRLYLKRGEFPAGSMGPKVESAVRFLEDVGERAIITSPANLVQAVISGGGTEIIRIREGVAGRHSSGAGAHG